jgi:hypothetical protein
MALAAFGRRDQPRALASVIRAEISASRTPRRRAPRIRFGQSSLSANRPRPGRQWPRNRATGPGASIGAY